MDLSTNDKKRRRLDGDESSEDASVPGRPSQTTALGGVLRDPDIWLPDGNIVIKAQNVAFRVHKSILALHSEIFRDLFLASSPSSNTSGPMKTIDDCPVIEVTDNANDLRHLFLVLCCGKNYYYRDDGLQAVPFDVLDSLIRMGHKYCVRSVLRDALARLQKYYSNDRSAWLDDAKRAQYVAAPEPSSATQTINTLAPLTNTPSLLPAAFLTCCGLVDPVIAEFTTGTPGPSLGMSADNIRRVINGRAALTRAGVDHIVGLVAAIPAQGCSSNYHCSCERAALSALSAHEEDSSLDEMQRRTAAPFVPLYEWFWGPGPQTGKLCGKCLAATKRKDEERCRESWLQLPAMLNIEVPGWPDRMELPT